jgi:homoserine dehydrogenase
VKIALLGLGQVGRSVLKILAENRTYYEQRFHRKVEIVVAADFHHMLHSEEGIDPQRLLYYKEKGDIWGTGYTEIDRETLFEREFDVLVDLMPATSDGLRARGLYLGSFSQSRDVVTACKSGLANFWPEIMKSAVSSGRQIRYEATVAGGVPFFSFIQQCLRSSIVTRILGQVNSAANFVLLNIANGETFDHAIEEAGKLGILEANYHFDTLGNDSAWKTVITANSVFGSKLKVNDIIFEGVEGLSPEVADLKYTRLLADIEIQDGKLVASSTLRKLEPSDPLASLKGTGLGFTVYMKGRAPLTVLEFSDGPTETATAVINDLLLL